MAGKTVGEVITKWGFRVDKKPLDDMKKSVAGLKASLMGLGAAGLANATAIFGLAEHTAGAANEMRKGAIQAGMGVMAFQEYANAAKMSGVGTEEFTHSMMHLNRGMYAARTGSKESMQAFAALGGGVASAVMHGENGDIVFGKVQERFSKMKDPVKAGALAMQLFGRSGAMMMPFLKKTPEQMKELTEEAQEMGLIFSQETIDASKAFSHELHSFEGAITGFKNIVGSSLIKPVADVLKGMNEWIKANRAFINSQIKQFLTGMMQSLKVSVGIFFKLAQIVTSLIRPIGGLGSALRVVLSIFTAIKALQFMSALGGMAMAAFELAKAWTFVGNMAWLANLKMIAIPAAVGALIVLTVLLIEDLIGALNGKNSLMSAVNDVFQKEFPRAFETVSFIIKAIGDSINWLIDKFKVFTGMADSMPGASILVKHSNPGQFTPPGMPEGPSGPQSAGVNPFSGQNSTSIQAPITVMVPDGTPAHEVGGYVQDGVQKALESHIRAGHRALSPGEAY